MKKLDVIEVMEIFDEVKSAKKCNQFACSNLEELHDKFTLLKNSVNGVLANYSKFSTLTAEINEKPLQDSFITNVDTLVSLTKEMKVEMDNIKKHIWL